MYKILFCIIMIFSLSQAQEIVNNIPFRKLADLRIFSERLLQEHPTIRICLQTDSYCSMLKYNSTSVSEKAVGSTQQYAALFMVVDQYNNFLPYTAESFSYVKFPKFVVGFFFFKKKHTHCVIPSYPT